MKKYFLCTVVGIVANMVIFEVNLMTINAMKLKLMSLT